MIVPRKLGRSDMSAPPIGMGCWAIGGPLTMDGVSDGWGNVDDAQSIRAIHAGINMGATLFDTSDAYGVGDSEEVIGQAVRGRRDRSSSPPSSVTPMIAAVVLWSAPM